MAQELVREIALTRAGNAATEAAWVLALHGVRRDIVGVGIALDGRHQRLTLDLQG